MAKENFQLHSQLLSIEKELKIISNRAYDTSEENKKLKLINKKYFKELEETKKEKELLYKTLKQGRTTGSVLNIKSPKSRKISLSELSKKNLYSDDERTERKIRSPSLKNKLKRIPRPKSRDSKLDSDHSTNCRLIKEIMSLYSINSPSLLLSMIRSSLADLKSVHLYKDFIQNIKKIIIDNSPPDTFKALPGLKTCMK